MREKRKQERERKWKERDLRRDVRERGERVRSASRRLIMEAKSFMQTEMVDGALRVFIEERSRGLISWIGLEPEGLKLVLSGLIWCCGEGREKEWSQKWSEDGREYRMEKGSNRAGIFIRLGVLNRSRKWISVVFPKGRQGHEGWEVIAKMLRHLGVRSEKSKMAEATRRWSSGINVGKSFAEAIKGKQEGLTGVCRIEVEERMVRESLRKLEHCLVASCKKDFLSEKELEEAREWARRNWGVEGGLRVHCLGTNRVVLEFEEKLEAIRVLKFQGGEKGGRLERVERWSLRLGCRGHSRFDDEVWVRVVGFPLQFWEKNILWMMGEACGGFVEVDERSRFAVEGEGVRLLVRREKEESPRELEIAMGEISYRVQCRLDSQDQFQAIFQFY